MNKFVKSIIVSIAMVAMVNVGSINVYAQTRTLTQANQIAEQCYRGYNTSKQTPISITQGQLIKESSNKNVYLITLSGQELFKFQPTVLMENLRLGFKQDNQYILRLVNYINKDIPKNSNLIIAGHSLGGMIAQQASGNSEIIDNYNVLNVVTFGSPLINLLEREGDLKRLGDKSDIYPYLSEMGTLLLHDQVKDLNTEDGGYGNRFTDAHIESYTRADEWGAYDVLGYKNGHAKLICDLDTARFFYVPYDSCTIN